MVETFAFATKSRGSYILDIRTSCDLSQGQSLQIHTGLTMSRCRAVAKALGAKCWNF